MNLGQSKRALRRHQKTRKLLRQLRILDSHYQYSGPWSKGFGGKRDGRCLHAHLNCNCMGQKDEPKARDLRAATPEEFDELFGHLPTDGEG